MNALEDDIKSQVEREITSCKECKKCLLKCPLPESDGIDIFHLNREIMSEKPSREIMDFAFLCFSCGACNYSCPEHSERDMHMVYLRSKGRLPMGYNNLLHWRGKNLGVLEKSLYRLKKIKDRPSRAVASHIDKEDFKESDLVFYFACYAFSPSKIPEKTLGIANKLGEEYEVIAGYKYCCGWPHFLAGDFERAESLFIDLFYTIENLGAKRVVTGCAECYKALKFIKERFLGEFEVLTTPQWILGNIEKLSLSESNLKVTFHDGCQLSRLEDLSYVPRDIIKRFADLVELKDNRKDTLCCGGMRAGHKIDELIALRKKRLSQAKESGASLMLTECVTCYEKFHPTAEEIEVKDLTEQVFDSIKEIS